MTNYYRVFKKNGPTKFKVTNSLNQKKKIVKFLFWKNYGLTLPPMAYENPWLGSKGRGVGDKLLTRLIKHHVQDFFKNN